MAKKLIDFRKWHRKPMLRAVIPTALCLEIVRACERVVRRNTDIDGSVQNFV